MSTNIPSPRRTLWKRVAVTSSTVTLAAMASLFGASYFKDHVVAASSEKISASSPNSGVIAIESLSKKIAAENEEHQALQSKRTALALSVQQTPALVLTPAERAHRQLVSQLVHLLALEKQYPEGSPEITQTRNQIDILQSLIADMPPMDRNAQTVTSPARVLLDAQLADADHRLVLNEAQTKSDISQLSQVVHTREIAAPRLHSRSGPAVSDIFLFSLPLGFLAGLLVVIFSRVLSVRDEALLRRLLPSTVELIGTIPHMRART